MASSSKWDGEKFCRPIDVSSKTSTYLHFFFERFQFHIKNSPALAAIISERFNYSVTDTCTIMLKQTYIYIYTVLPKFNFKHQGMFF